jgi:peroxiredoxin
MLRLSLSTLIAASSPATVLAEPDQPKGQNPAPAAPASMPGLKVGDKAPDPQLAKPNGDPVQLSELYARTPIVLVFYRGGWCPYCNKQLSGLQEHLERIAIQGAFIIAVTPEGPSQIEKTTADQKITYAILSDYKHEAAEQFKILFEMSPEMQEKYKGYGVDLSTKNWDRTWRLPHPAAYVIDKEGTIRYAFCAEDYKQRADPEAILAVLEDLAAEREAAKKK